MTLPYRRLLVGLDGTPWAETLLAVLEHWARRESEITLLHVLEEDGPEKVHGAQHLRDPQEASAYLERCARRLEDRGRATRTLLLRARRKDLPETLAATARREGHDLVLLATHGRVDPRRWLRGSVAQHVLARTRTDVLQLTPRYAGPAPGSGPRTILVPLDGERGHEVALDRALELARSENGSLCLAHILPGRTNPGGLDTLRAHLAPTTDRLVRGRRERAGERYLARCARRLAGEGVRITTHLGRGDPATELAALVRSCRNDLVALASHGRFGSALWGQARLPGLLVERLDVPLLVIRADA